MTAHMLVTNHYGDQKKKGHPGGLNASELEPLAPPWQDQLRRTASPELMAFQP